MPSSLSLKSILNIAKNCIVNPKWILVETWILRIILGATFIFSGLTKAIDPWGTIYKLQDYLAALDFTLWPNIVTLFAFILFSVEFLIGIFIILGIARTFSSRLALTIMLIMLGLSLWIALKNPVDDCGCFGDALIISNWATFFKNIILTGTALWLFRFNRMAPALIRANMQWIATLFSVAYILVVSFIGFVYQPMIDFRPFPIGKNLINPDSFEQSPKIKFLYARNGEERIFSESEIPDSSEGWKFIKRVEDKDNITKTDKTAQPEEFSIWDGDENVTSDLIPTQGEMILVSVPNIRSASKTEKWKIDRFHDWAINHDAEMIMVATGSENELQEWKQLSMSDYPIYTAEDTQLKMLARGNPAIIYIKDGKIIWKRSLMAIDGDKIEPLSKTFDLEKFAINSEKQFLALSLTLLSLFAFLMLLSYLPLPLLHHMRPNSNKSEQDRI